jgi:hypothetical protein
MGHEHGLHESGLDGINELFQSDHGLQDRENIHDAGDLKSLFM